MNVAIILAGGSGNRFGSERPKQFLEVAGKQIIEHSIDAFERNALIDEICIVTRADYLDEVKALVARGGYRKVKKVIQGGQERYTSSVAAIDAYQIDSITHTDEIIGSQYDLTDSIVYPPHMNAMMGVMLQAIAGAPNSVLCSQENTEALFSQTAQYNRAGEPWTHSAIFSLVDDDALDEFIPSSSPGQSISNSDKKVGGYFSLLYPLIRSLEVKYGVSLSCGIAAEGQRIGLTPYWSASDECAINENGELMQQLLAHTNWELLCHSMTTRISPDGSVYVVDSLNTPEANDILANGKWGGAYSFYTAGVYDRQTHKNYTITGERNKWVETKKKYIQPYCYDTKSGQWVYNESYPLEYQIGEWKRRATQLGFTYPDIMVHWGNTTTGQLINKSRTYFSHSVDPSGLVEDGTCYVYDIGFRLTGSLEYKILEHIYGYNPLKMMLRYALTGRMTEENKPLNINPVYPYPAFNVSCLCAPGTIERIEGTEALEDEAHILGTNIAHLPGDTITEQMRGLLAQITVRVLGYVDSIDNLLPMMNHIEQTIIVRDTNGRNIRLSNHIGSKDIEGQLII